MTDSSTLLFSKNWTIYQKIIHANFMLHNEFGSITKHILDNIDGNRTITFLDLGCGDASHLAYHLTGFKLSSYTGYDMSSSALELATENIPQISKSMFFQEGNMVQLLDKDTNQYSVIYSSYAIHHLDQISKAKLFNDIYQKLATNGLFIYIDIYKQKEQTRIQYISDYTEWMEREWALLADEEKNLVYSHIEQFDFPEEISFIIHQLCEIGFQLKEIHQDDPRHFLLFCKK